MAESVEAQQNCGNECLLELALSTTSKLWKTLLRGMMVRKECLATRMENIMMATRNRGVMAC